MGDRLHQPQPFRPARRRPSRLGRHSQYAVAGIRREDMCLQQVV